MGTVAPPPDDQSKIVMGYPPVNPYPQPPYVYPTPDLAYHNPIGYSNPVPPNPYPPPYYYQRPFEPLVTEPSRTTSIGRAMLSLLIVLTIGMCLLSIIIFLLFGTDTPGFHIVSLAVPSFNVTNTTLVASWIVNLTVTNQNEAFNIQFEHVVSSIFYDDDMLAISPLQPFQVDTRQTVEMGFRVMTDSTYQEKLHDGVFPDILHDRNNGVVFFSLRMSLKAQYTSTSLWKKSNLKVNCKNLQVRFLPNGEGKLTDDLPHECLVLTR